MGYGLAGTRVQRTCFSRMIHANANAGSPISCRAAQAMHQPFASSAPNCSRFGSIWMPDTSESKGFAAFLDFITGTFAGRMSLRSYGFADAVLESFAFCGSFVLFAACAFLLEGLLMLLACCSCF